AAGTAQTGLCGFLPYTDRCAGISDLVPFPAVPEPDRPSVRAVPFALQESCGCRVSEILQSVPCPCGTMHFPKHSLTLFPFSRLFSADPVSRSAWFPSAAPSDSFPQEFPSAFPVPPGFLPVLRTHFCPHYLFPATPESALPHSFCAARCGHSVSTQGFRLSFPDIRQNFRCPTPVVREKIPHIQ